MRILTQHLVTLRILRKLAEIKVRKMMTRMVFKVVSVPLVKRGTPASLVVDIDGESGDSEERVTDDKQRN